MWTVLTPYIQTIPAWLHEQAQVWLGDRAFEYDRIPWAVPTAPGEVGAPMSQESQAACTSDRHVGETHAPDKAAM